MKIKLAIFLTLLSCWSCQRSASKNAANSKPLVLVSIAPYQFLTERVAGNAVQIQTVVPQGANPHSFEPTSQQVETLTRGIVWFRIGEPFEEKIIPILKGRNQEMAIHDLREGLSLIEEGDHLSCSHCSMDHLDRHVWLSPKLAAVQAKAIETALSEQFPELTETFQQNFNQLQTELRLLDEEIMALLKPVQDRVLLVSHPAFGYFCKDYHFEQLSIEYEGKDPRPKHLEEILLKATSHHAEIALALPQYNNKGAQIIADKLHLPVHLIDPYSSEYFETLRRLAHLIANPQMTDE